MTVIAVFSSHVHSSFLIAPPSIKDSIPSIIEPDIDQLIQRVLTDMMNGEEPVWGKNFDQHSIPLLHKIFLLAYKNRALYDQYKEFMHPFMARAIWNAFEEIHFREFRASNPQEVDTALLIFGSVYMELEYLVKDKKALKKNSPYQHMLNDDYEGSKKCYKLLADMLRSDAEIAGITQKFFYFIEDCKICWVSHNYGLDDLNKDWWSIDHIIPVREWGSPIEHVMDVFLKKDEWDRIAKSLLFEEVFQYSLAYIIHAKKSKSSQAVERAEKYFIWALTDPEQETENREARITDAHPSQLSHMEKQLTAGHSKYCVF